MSRYHDLARERLAAYKVLGKSELAAELSDLVLEKEPEGLDYLLEIDIVGKTAHIVVALDHCRVASET